MPKGTDGRDDRAGKTQPQIRVTAAERRRQVLELRLGGLNFRQIAAQVGYANPGAAHRAYLQELRAIPAAAADELRTTELERYDEWQARLTARLRTGDMSVIRDLIRLSDQRARLTGLYAADTTAEHVDVKITLSAMLQDAIDLADEEDAEQADAATDDAA